MVLVRQNIVVQNTGSRFTFTLELQKLMQAIPSRLTRLQKVRPLISAKNNHKKLSTRAQLMGIASVMMNNTMQIRLLVNSPTKNPKTCFWPELYMVMPLNRLLMAATHKYTKLKTSFIGLNGLV